jgi:hypothetical protein
MAYHFYDIVVILIIYQTRGRKVNSSYPFLLKGVLFYENMGQPGSIIQLSQS